MSSLASLTRFRVWRRRAALVAGLALSVCVAGCGSVANKTGAGGMSGAGGVTGPGDGGLGGAPGGDGAAGAPGDARGDQVTPPPADGGDAGGGTGARWDIDNWDNAQWN